MSYISRNEVKEKMADTITSPGGFSISSDSMFSQKKSSSYSSYFVLLLIVIIAIYFAYNFYTKNQQTLET